MKFFNFHSSNYIGFFNQLINNSAPAFLSESSAGRPNKFAYQNVIFTYDSLYKQLTFNELSTSNQQSNFLNLIYLAIQASNIDIVLPDTLFFNNDIAIRGNTNLTKFIQSLNSIHPNIGLINALYNMTQQEQLAQQQHTAMQPASPG